MASRHFADREFACKDGCGIRPRAVQELQHRLEKLRGFIGKPIPIVSGYRCPPRNAAVGGATRSRHTLGEAADIPRSLKVTTAQAKAAGFTGIGVKDGYVTHVDVRQGAVTVWQY